MSKSPPVSVFLVLSLGALAGGVVKGLTGFGNAILNLLVWVVFTAAGVDGGPLQMAVLADTLGCIVCAIPLLFMTSAHKTADWRLLVTIAMFTTAGAPLGTALLTGLNPRWVELVMACVLLLVICLHVKLHEKLADVIRSKRRSGSHGLLDGPSATNISTDEQPLPTRAKAGAKGMDASLQCIAVDSLPSPLQSARPSAASCSACLPLIADEPESPTMKHQPTQSSDGDEACAATAEDGSAEAAQAGNSANRSGSASSANCSMNAQCSANQCTSGLAQDAEEAQATRDSTCIGAARCASSRRGGGKDDCSCVSDTEPLLRSNGMASDTADAASAPVAATCSIGDADGESAACSCSGGDFAGGGTARGISARLRAWVARQDWPAMRRILTIGSLAGFASGVMGGMTGIGGPPIMFMYEKLKVPKEVVRGTNAINNALQFKIIFYLAMGVFKSSDAPVYAVTSVVGLVGVGIGNLLAGRIDQTGFSRIMVALMVTCCLLLFLSAAGLKGHRA